MNKLSNRLKAIVKFVDKKDSIVDVGCDHGYLSIYLIENKLVKKAVKSSDGVVLNTKDKVDAIEELKNEIAREISISGSCETVLMSENQKEDLVDTLISLNLYDGSNINAVHDNFKIAINKANKCREYAVEMLRDEDVNVTEIHAQTDELRLLNSSLAKQKEEYENLTTLEIGNMVQDLLNEDLHA